LDSFAWGVNEEAAIDGGDEDGETRGRGGGRGGERVVVVALVGGDKRGAGVEGPDDLARGADGVDFAIDGAYD
jgi:hypothetical protein